MSSNWDNEEIIYDNGDDLLNILIIRKMNESHRSDEVMITLYDDNGDPDTIFTDIGGLRAIGHLISDAIHTYEKYRYEA